MVRALSKEDRSEAGASQPIARPRLVERLRAAAAYPITLLIAPAGYGKSVTLRQYLGTLSETKVRFGVRSEHATLLGFLRGLVEAFGEFAPHAMASLADAFERNTASGSRSADLAGWMHAHLDSFSGVVAIDDLHIADADPEIARFASCLIERTKGQIRWILASRSTTGLPVGTWLAYRDADLPIDEHALRFTSDEAGEAADRLGLAIRDEELRELLALTEGWPAAMSFALRSTMRSTDLRDVSSLTREMIYRLLAEQVYAALDDVERSLLEVASVLPVIDVHVLERAGFDRALTILDRLRERTSFIYEESAGTYQCHDLFRDFLRYQSALSGKRRQLDVHLRAARALEQSADIEHAITSYVTAGSSGDAVRLLEQHGFDLLEKARGDVVARAIEALDDKACRENAAILALQGALQASAGKFTRAEALFKRALSRAGGNRDFVATVSLRLASIMANQGQDVTDLLGVVGYDSRQGAARRVEALSLIAAQRAAAGDQQTARKALSDVDALIQDVDSDRVRARAFQHVGIAYHHLGMVKNALEVLTLSSDIADELHLYSTVSRANAVLSNLALHEKDDVELQLHYAELAAAAATKAGDAFALQIALLGILSARMRRGEVQKSIEVEQRLAAVRESDLAIQYLAIFRASRLAWEGRFAEARQLLGSCWLELPYEFDRAVCGSQFALCLAVNGEREPSVNVVAEVLGLISSMTARGLFRVRSVAIARVLCAVAEGVNRRSTFAERILRGVKEDGDDVIAVAIKSAELVLEKVRYGDTTGFDRMRAAMKSLVNLGYADVAALLGALDRVLSYGRLGLRDMRLTRGEVDILRLLAEGFTPKEISSRTERSVYTVRAHIANVIAKLGCHGRAEAIKIAQRLGLI